MSQEHSLTKPNSLEKIGPYSFFLFSFYMNLLKEIIIIIIIYLTITIVIP